MRFATLAATALSALLLSACGGDRAAGPRGEDPLPDLSGLAWLGGDRFLAVHDAKNPAEDDRIRASILRLPRSLAGVDAHALDVEWPDPLGKSNDLESADPIPGTNRVLLAESGDGGGPFRRIFLAEVGDESLEIHSFAPWPEQIENVEGIAVARVGRRLVFLWAERAQGEAATTIWAGPMETDPLRFEEPRGVEFTTPESHTPATRPVSALAVDSRGRLYVGTAFDRDVGDNGPYRSSVWRIGRVRTTLGIPHVVLDPEPTLLGTLDGLKVESVAVREQGGRFDVYVGTDDENWGGVLRPLPPPG
ncbi:MAG: hypothetical protein ICV64_09635 [Thermoleophilia bacterium]|nr:hypothetical protein [Thermoleophilia bacterium]